ncbi:hypothetical protein, partial [Mesorhizobium sp.]|uniref:hypothetical protein n=1 Tax=Mesorhizobium sp. TaxID=1871066 RepID=UPI0025E6AADE
VKAAAPSVPASSSPSKSNRCRHPPDRQEKGGLRAALFRLPAPGRTILRGRFNAMFPPMPLNRFDYKRNRLRLEPGTMLTMGPESANRLVGPTVCKTEPRPQNCPAASALKVDAQFPPKP